MKERVNQMPWVSGLLVAVNVIVFLICTFTGDMLYNMGEVGVLYFIQNKEFYRIITSMFLHADIYHLVNNMIVLFGIGMMIEQDVGHIRYGSIYILAGIGGNVLSAIWEVVTRDFYVSIGASGAVFGLDGMLLALVLLGGYEKGNQLETVTPARVIFMVGYSIYNGFTVDNINNAAHIGGLIVGFLATVPLCVCRKICRNGK